MKKIKDLVVKVGTYEKDGETKNKYENIGAIMERDDGGKFMFLKRSFNPAGVPYKNETESIIVSMFDVKNQDTINGDNDNDEIPF
jgi:hypothetical protein